MKKLHLSVLAALFLTASPALADLITGRVVTPGGLGLAGVNINAYRVDNGNEITLANDGTNANGDFSTTIPAGVYDLVFFPPAPPLTSYLPLVLKNQVVTGTVNLGTLMVAQGVLLSGHVQTQSGIPVGQVGLTVIDGPTGDVLPLAVPRTNAFGDFNIPVPAHALELQLDATGIVSPVLASRSFSLSPTGNTNLGNIVLQDGFVVSGQVRRTTGGTAVAGVDLDFIDIASGVKLFTPNDNSNSLGNFSVVVPAGNYDVEFCPPFATHLVGKLVTPVAVSGATAMGVVNLDAGFVLSGTIRDFSGTPQSNADVDVNIQSSGAKVVTCADNSNASGIYQVIVPAGNLLITFHPPTYAQPLASDLHPNVLISGNLSLDGSLPACPAPVSYGAGLAGLGGLVPQLTVSGGTARVGNPSFAYELANGRGGAPSLLVVSGSPANAPLFGGTLLVQPAACCSIKFFQVLGGTPGVAGAGSKHLPVPFPLSRAVGLDVYSQLFVRDLAAPAGWAMSRGLQYHVCP